MGSRQHGDYSHEWQSELLILRLHGAFNEAAINTFFLSLAGVIQAHVKAHPNAKWALLSSLDQDMLGTPKTLGIIKFAYRWSQENGCIAAAISNANAVVKHVFVPHFESLEINTNFFDTETQAIDWLNQQLKNAATSSSTPTI